MWIGLGLVACACTANINYQTYRKLAWPLFIIAIVLLAGVLVLGPRINGSTRWYVFGPVRFQPSEFAKYVLVMVLAVWLEKMQRGGKGELRPRIRHWWWGVFAPIAITCMPAALIFREPDLGTTLLLGAVTMILLWAAGSPASWLGAITGAGVVFVTAFLLAIFKYDMFQDSYQVQRILHWWREDDLQGSNYQQWIAMLAFGRGGLHGEGLGNSLMKMAYLPEAQTDFIFIIMPNGSSLRIDNVPATDASGYAGLQDKVDFHTWALLKGVALSTILGVGTELTVTGESDLVQAIREATQQNVSRAGDQITQRNLQIQPTITIRPGALVLLVLHRDLIVPPWRGQER